MAHRCAGVRPSPDSVHRARRAGSRLQPMITVAALTGSVCPHLNPASNGAFDATAVRRNLMSKTTYTDSAHTAEIARGAADAPHASSGLPNRLLTAFEVAEFIGCHEETVRRAYLRGLLISQRFGVRGRRFHPADVLDWIRRGSPTRAS